jgi:hypothetical protein
MLDPKARLRQSEMMRERWDQQYGRMREANRLSHGPEARAKQSKSLSDTWDNYRVSYLILRMLLSAAELDEFLKGKKGLARFAAAHRVMQEVERQL